MKIGGNQIKKLIIFFSVFLCCVLIFTQISIVQCASINDFINIEANPEDENIINVIQNPSKETQTQAQNQSTETQIQIQNQPTETQIETQNQLTDLRDDEQTQTTDKQTEQQAQQNLLKASQITPFNSKKGFFLIHIKGEGKETIRRINVNLTSTNRGSSQTIYFEEKDIDGYIDNYNFQIRTTSAKTKATKQNSYALFSFQFSYTKPAHLKASHWYSNKTGNERFNFNKSPTDTTTTINNTGHNVNDTNEIIDMQINLANCGIASLEVTPTNATGHIELKRDYYSGLNIDPNGGTHDGKNYSYNYGIKCCDSVVTINKPTRNGYAFIGWTFSKGSNCGYTSFDKNTSKFKYCGKSTSNSNVGNDNTCTLKAEWIKNNSDYILPEAGSNLNTIGIYHLIRNYYNNFHIKKTKN